MTERRKRPRRAADGNACMRRAGVDWKTVALLLAVVAILALAIGLARRWAVSEARNADFPDGTLWVCGNRDCGKDFTLSLEEVAHFYATNSDGRMVCPHCSRAGAERAQRCNSCARVFPRAIATTARVCPHCKAPLVQRAE